MEKKADVHTVLYRKYRPHDWKDVIGQDHITKVLKGSVEHGNISHAYIFSGSRGTGKTSVARIFAREIGTTENDLYEIDAASQTGVDDMRELNEAVSTLPMDSEYKVYILDEVHMLSKSSFNALLKTLEEPPAHVVFVLATTEPHKIPETVHSRCQGFEFKQPSRKILKELVIDMAKKEGFDIEPSSAELMALMGDGSFRDTQSILQKVLGFSKNKKISEEEVEMVTGAPKKELVNNFIAAIAEKDIAKGLEAVKEATKNNIDIKTYSKMILEKLRALLLLRFDNSIEKELQAELSDTDFEFLKGLASQPDLPINSKTLLEMLDAQDMIGRSNIPELPLELALVNLVGE